MTWQGKRRKALTAAELIGYLSALPQDLPIVAWYDAGCAHGDVVEVWTRDTDGVPSVMLTVD